MNNSLSFILVMLLTFNIILLLCWRKERQLRMKQNQDLDKIYWLARQVIHDVASPLGALNAVEQDLGLSQNMRELLVTAKDRIEKVLEDLNCQSNALWKSSEMLTFGKIRELVIEILKEKTAVYRFVQFNLSWQGPDGFCRINSNQFQRSLSNILQNSIEALGSKQGLITISGNSVAQNVVSVNVTDCGIGVDTTMSPKFGEQGCTFGKANGQGLGLSYAKAFVEQSGGSLEFESLPNIGTRVSMAFPKVEEL